MSLVDNGDLRTEAMVECATVLLTLSGRIYYRRRFGGYHPQKQALGSPTRGHINRGYDYDPYAFDVGCYSQQIVVSVAFVLSKHGLFVHIFHSVWSRLYRCWCRCLIIFGMMLTDDVKARFTAREALECIEEIDKSLTTDQRCAPTAYQNAKWKDIGLRREGLPADFVQQWSRYRHIEVG